MSILILLILSVVVYVVYLCTGNTSFGFVQERVGDGNYTFGDDPKIGDPRNGNVKHHVPKFMLDLYRKSFKTDQERGDTQPDVVKSVVPKGASKLDELKETRHFFDLGFKFLFCSGLKTSTFGVEVASICRETWSALLLWNNSVLL